MNGIAGEYGLAHGGNLDPKITRLKATDADADGIDIELHGGRHNDRKQKAVLSMICDKSMTGNEGFEEDKSRSLLRRDDDDDEDGDKGSRYKQDPDTALQFVSYGEVEDGKERFDVLRMTWRTKYACEDVEDDGDDGDDDNKSAGWGFFTWFFLL